MEEDTIPPAESKPKQRIQGEQLEICLDNITLTKRDTNKLIELNIDANEARVVQIGKIFFKEPKVFLNSTVSVGGFVFNAKDPRWQIIAEIKKIGHINKMTMTYNTLVITELFQDNKRVNVFYQPRTSAPSKK